MKKKRNESAFEPACRCSACTAHRKKKDHWSTFELPGKEDMTLAALVLKTMGYERMAHWLERQALKWKVLRSTEKASRP